MMPLLLSVCLPTYNRASLLDGALRAALGQITPAMRGAVEVVVLDNASPDATPDVVARAQADFPHVTLRHVRRPENIGPDANFCDAPNQARGEFVYLLSDDDILLPGAIDRLLEVLRQHPSLDAVSLNVRQFWEDPGEERPGAYLIDADRLLPDRDQALAFLRTHITFLSCIAFRRENVLGRDYRSFFDTNLAQAYMFLDALAPGRGMYATQRAYLAQRADNNEGFDFFRVFATNFSDLMRHAEAAGYSRKAVGEVMHQHLRLMCYFIGVFKSRGAIGTIRPDYHDGFRRLWRVYGADPFLILVVGPMMVLPRPVFALLFTRMHALYRHVKAWRRGAGAAGPRTSVAH